MILNNTIHAYLTLSYDNQNQKPTIDFHDMFIDFHRFELNTLEGDYLMKLIEIVANFFKP